MEMPAAPAASGQHPVILVVITANDLVASSTFYAAVFGWQLMKMSDELTAVSTPAGPSAALRANTPAGFPGVVPFLAVRDVRTTVSRVVDAGAVIERAPWTVPMMGTLARFTDVSGTVYGLTDALASGGSPPSVPMPFGTNPEPPAGAICSLEMFAKYDASPRSRQSPTSMSPTSASH